MARGVRQADRPARHRLRHPRTRRVERRRRHPYGDAGFDADDRLRRPGRRRFRRSRSVPGNRLPAHVRQRRQMGGADRSRRAHSRVRRARVSRRDVGPAGPVVLALPEDMLTRARECADAPRVEPRRRGARCRADRDGARAARRRAAAAGDRRRQPLGRAACAALRAFAEANALPVACAFRNQDLFDNRHPNYAGDVGIGINPKLAARVRDADVLLVIGERLGEMTTSGYTLLEVPGAEAAADPRASRRRRAGPRLPAGAGDRGDARRVPRRDESRCRRIDAAAWRDARRSSARRSTRRGERRGPCPARSTCGRSCAGSTSGCPTTRSSPTAPATTRRGCIGSTATAAFARSSRPTPARWAMACRRRSRRRRCIATASSSRGTATAAS